MWVGLVGAILLVMKRRPAEWALALSLLAALLWFAGLLLVSPLREAMSANDLLVAIASLSWHEGSEKATPMIRLLLDGLRYGARPAV